MTATEVKTPCTPDMKGEKKKTHRGGVPGLVATRKGSGANLLPLSEFKKKKREMRMNTT